MKHLSLFCCMAIVATAAMAQTPETLYINEGQSVRLFPYANKILTGTDGYSQADDLEGVKCISVHHEINDKENMMFFPLNVLHYTDNGREGNTLLYNWAALSGSNSYQTDYMNGLYFYALTNIKGQKVSFIIPNDEAFTFVPNVLTYSAQVPTVLNLKYNTKPSAASNPVLYEVWRYSIHQDERDGTSYLRNATMTTAEVANVLTHILRQHTVVGDLNSGNEYFKTLDGTVVRYKDGAFQSSREIELEDAEIAGRKANVVEHKSHDNNDFYVVDRVLTQTGFPAWVILDSDERCEGFANLCSELAEEAAAQDWPSDLSSDEVNALIEHSSIFLAKTSTPCSVVSMFANTDFTLFVPSNEAIAAERAAGRLSTFEQKRNFVLYHFCYGSEYADRLPFEGRAHATPLVLGTGRCVNPQLTVSSAGNGTLSVTDATGRTVNVLPDGKNIFTYDFVAVDDRDNEANIQDQSVSNMNKKRIGRQAPGVIHLIDGMLKYKK